MAVLIDSIYLICTFEYMRAYMSVCRYSVCTYMIYDLFSCLDCSYDLTGSAAFLSSLKGPLESSPFHSISCLPGCAGDTESTGRA